MHGTRSKKNQQANKKELDENKNKNVDVTEEEEETDDEGDEFSSIGSSYTDGADSKQADAKEAPTDSTMQKGDKQSHKGKSQTTTKGNRRRGRSQERKSGAKKPVDDKDVSAAPQESASQHISETKLSNQKTRSQKQKDIGTDPGKEPEPLNPSNHSSDTRTWVYMPMSFTFIIIVVISLFYINNIDEDEIFKKLTDLEIQHIDDEWTKAQIHSFARELVSGGLSRFDKAKMREMDRNLKRASAIRLLVDGNLIDRNSENLKAFVKEVVPINGKWLDFNVSDKNYTSNTNALVNDINTRLAQSQKALGISSPIILVNIYGITKESTTPISQLKNHLSDSLITFEDESISPLGIGFIFSSAFDDLGDMSVVTHAEETKAVESYDKNILGWHPNMCGRIGFKLIIKKNTRSTTNIS